MEDYRHEFQEIAAAIESLQALKKNLFQHYSTVVGAVINNRISDPCEIETIMDSLADFGDNVEFLELYRKLCRHVYYTYPEMVGEHVALFRALFVNSEDSKKNS